MVAPIYPIRLYYLPVSCKHPIEYFPVELYYPPVRCKYPVEFYPIVFINWFPIEFSCVPNELQTSH
jgi:hypothetical protein